MQRLQTLSLQSNELLNEILNSKNSGDLLVKDEKEEFQIEFIDTQLKVKEESLLELETECLIGDSNQKKQVLQTVPESTAEPNHGLAEKGLKKKIKKKIACEMCGKLVESNLIKYHLNTHEGKRNSDPTLVEAELLQIDLFLLYQVNDHTNVRWKIV